MKSNIEKFFFFLLIPFFLHTPALDLDTGAVNAADQDVSLKSLTITLANGDYNPFFSETLKHYGVVSRIVKEAFFREGIKVKYVFRPWKRGLEEAAKGKWHGTVGWLKTDERLKKFYYSAPIMKPTTVFFQRKNNPIEWEKVSDLKGIKIGLITGFFYGDEFKAAEDRGVITVIRSVDALHSFKMLINGRIDVAAAEQDVGLNILKTKFKPEKAENIEPQKKVIHSKDLFMLLSRKKSENKELIKLFNRGLSKLEVAGKIEQYWNQSRRGDYLKR